ncbi:hypothetical protein Patl1_25338 [Pistacia atlantica]|uniref:Uncharacterized protein n=1 Tax=Pistacia atlantica TaxID=434234 RepID=A0ACC1B0V2_9ROSI|nr:hypothetical protein Patl1_25338 [Pistacia atlantica]
MTAVTAVLRLLTFTLFVATSVQLPLPDGCSPVLVAFSPCLQYVSAPPNNMAETAAHLRLSTERNQTPFAVLLFATRVVLWSRSAPQVRALIFAPKCNCSRFENQRLRLGSSQTDLPPLHGGMTGPEIPNPPDSGSKQQFPFPSDSGEPQFPIPKPPDSNNLPQFPIPKPPDSSNLPHFPIPKPPDSSNLPHFPIPKPSDNLPPLPIPKPFDNHPQLPIPKPSDNHPQLTNSKTF